MIICYLTPCALSVEDNFIVCIEAAVAFAADKNRNLPPFVRQFQRGRDNRADIDTGGFGELAAGNVVHPIVGDEDFVAEA